MYKLVNVSLVHSCNAGVCQSSVTGIRSVHGCVSEQWLVSDLSTGGVPSVLECVRTVWLLSDLSTGGVRSFQEYVSEHCDWCPLCPRVCVRTVRVVSDLSTGLCQCDWCPFFPQVVSDLYTCVCQNGMTGVWSVHRCVSERCNWCLICPQTRAMQVCVRTEGHARVSLNRERRGCCTATPVSAHLVTWAPPVKVSRGERERARYHWFEYYRNNKHFEDFYFFPVELKIVLYWRWFFS